MEAVADDTPYLSVDHALRYAFGVEALTGEKICAISDTSKGTNPSALTPMDRIAEASMLRSAATRAAGYYAPVLRAYYGKAAGRDLRCRKVWAIVLLGRFLAKELRRPDRLMSDVVRDWCGERMRKEYKDWAREIGVSERTIHRWCKSRKDNSAILLLTGWHSLTLSRVEVEFVERGIIPG